MTQHEKVDVYRHLTQVLDGLYVKPDRSDVDIHNIGMLNLISHQLRRMWFAPKTYRCEVVTDETDPTGEGLALQFRPELIAEMGWGPGTTLVWERGDAPWTLRKADEPQAQSADHASPAEPSGSGSPDAAQ